MARLLFVQREGRELNSVMAISSYISDRHESAVFVDSKNCSLEQKIKEYNPDVIGISLMTKDHFWGVETLQKIDKINPKILKLLGGPHPTFYTKIINEKGVDALCIGEGEKAVKHLLDKIDNHEEFYDIPSLWIKKEGNIYKNSLDAPLKQSEIPNPKREIYMGVEGVNESSDLLVMCSRGCPFDCHFCFNYGLRRLYKSQDLAAPHFRVREPESIIEEIKSAQKFRKIKSISFEDDIFGLNKKWLNQFHKLYRKEINLPFYSLLRFDVITPELIRELKEMGCLGVAVGIESGDEELRNNVLGKKLSDEKIYRGAEILKSEGMPFNTYIMFGLPGETLDLAWKSLNMNLEIKANVAFTQLFHPYPGTRFFEEGGEAVERAIISREFSRFRINYPYDKDWRQIQRLQKFSMVAASYPWLKSFIPLLIQLPFNEFYDKISELAWKKIYDKQKREGFK